VYSSLATGDAATRGRGEAAIHRGMGDGRRFDGPAKVEDALTGRTEGARQ
jgi:hypothetical protein